MCVWTHLLGIVLDACPYVHNVPFPWALSTTKIYRGVKHFIINFNDEDHNIFQIHNNVLWDSQYYVEYSS